MFRRRFLQKLSYAGVATLAVAPPSDASGKRTVVLPVKGFTCVTCAVGLETMLRRQPGILHAEASYPQGRVRIEFDPALVTEDSLKRSIAELGFRVDDGRGRK